MFNFFKKKEEQVMVRNDSLFLSFKPLALEQNVFYDKVENFKISDIKRELLDISFKKEALFNIYYNFNRDVDSLIFKSFEISSVLFEVLPKFIGREYSKTCSFSLEDDAGESFPLLLEVLSGSGYVLLQNGVDELEIKLVKVEGGSRVLVPKGFSYVLINSSLEDEFYCQGFYFSQAKILKNVLEKNGGASIFCVKSGFIRNNNISPIFNLKEYDGNYMPGEVNFMDAQIYFEFLRDTSKFSFLKE